MFGQSIRDVVNAGHALLDALELQDDPALRVGQISHGEVAVVDAPLASDEQAARGALDRLDVIDADVPDNLPGAIETSRQLFDLDRQNLGYHPIEVMVVLSDGGQTFAAPQVLAAAEEASAAGILVIPVCIQNRLADCPTMSAIASREELSFEVDGTSELADLFTLAGHSQPADRQHASHLRRRASPRCRIYRRLRVASSRLRSGSACTALDQQLPAPSRAHAEL